MSESFAFVDAGRTFDCSVEPLGRGTETWWWFRVSSEQHQRFAPFRTASDDTQDVVRGRILAYYDELLARRAAPAAPRWQRRSDAARPAAATPATPASS